jgi:ADP-ribose pyrophosphatase
VVEPERPVRAETLVEGRLLTFRRDTVIDAKGAERTREVVVHPGGVGVLAVTADRRLLLVRQYRHAVGDVCLEIPAGTLDRQPDGTTEDPFAAARRELAEETGYLAGGWRKLGSFWTAPGFTTEEMHLYLATDLTEDVDGAGPDEEESLELESVPLDEVVALVEGGAVRDAKTIVGILWLARLVEAGELRR